MLSFRVENLLFGFHANRLFFEEKKEQIALFALFKRTTRAIYSLLFFYKSKAKLRDTNLYVYFKFFSLKRSKAHSSKERIVLVLKKVKRAIPSLCSSCSLSRERLEQFALVALFFTLYCIGGL